MAETFEERRLDLAQRHGGYFPHVDGLRCLAIASVVAYYAKIWVEINKYTHFSNVHVAHSENDRGNKSCR